MAALMADLVAVPTENPPGRNYSEFADLFEKRIAKLGLRCERLEPSSKRNAADDTPACVAVSYGQGDRVFYFHGHYDVVPRNPKSNSKQAAKGISCLGAALAT